MLIGGSEVLRSTMTTMKIDVNERYAYLLRRLRTLAESNRTGKSLKTSKMLLFLAMFSPSRQRVVDKLVQKYHKQAAAKAKHGARSSAITEDGDEDDEIEIIFQKFPVVPPMREFSSCAALVEQDEPPNCSTAAASEVLSTIEDTSTIQRKRGRPRKIKTEPADGNQDCTSSTRRRSLPSEEDQQSKDLVDDDLVYLQKLTAVRKFIKDNGLMYCMACKKSLQAKGIHLHFLSHSNFALFSCTVCSKTFKTEMSALRHLAKHPWKSTAEYKDNRQHFDTYLAQLVDHCFPFVNQPKVILSRKKTGESIYK